MTTRSKHNSIEIASDGQINIRVTAAPVRGKANSAMISLLSKHIGVPKSHMRIVRGRSSRYKMVEVDDVSEQN